jgi:hypothetical protein
MLNMNDALGFALGAGTCAIAYIAHSAYQKLVGITASFTVLEQASDKLDRNTELLVQMIETYAKASADNDKAANSIAKSAVQMQEMLAEIQSILMPPDQSEQKQPLSMFTLQDSFESIQKELIEQGIDPETAKYKAAEYELERLSSGDLSEISMSL